jgi:purine-nucleoside phosphorylase
MRGEVPRGSESVIKKREDEEENNANEEEDWCFFGGLYRGRRCSVVERGEGVI